MGSALELAERFEQLAEQTGGFSTATAWAFSNILVAEGQNSEENFITLARYGLFIKNNAVFVAFLEVLDGGEAQENLYKRVAERYGRRCGTRSSPASAWHPSASRRPKSRAICSRSSRTWSRSSARRPAGR